MAALNELMRDMQEARLAADMRRSMGAASG
jgi:hypothetical protein